MLYSTQGNCAGLSEMSAFQDCEVQLEGLMEDVWEASMLKKIPASRVTGRRDASLWY